MYIYIYIYIYCETETERGERGRTDTKRQIDRRTHYTHRHRQTEKQTASETEPKYHFEHCLTNLVANAEQSAPSTTQREATEPTVRHTSAIPRVSSLSLAIMW